MGFFQKPSESNASGLKIIIVGCGKIGSTIVNRLVGEGHEIAVVDTDPEVIRLITDRHDVMGVVGNAASFRVLQEAGIENADLLVAATESDELNLLCCTIAKRNKNCEVIARVRTPEYNEEIDYFKETFGMAALINPDHAAAVAISHMLFLPNAISVNTFAKGMAEMICVRLPEKHILAGKRLMDIGRDLTESMLICGVERYGQVHIPKGNFVLHAGDEITFITPVNEGTKVLKRLGFDTKPAKNTIIVGGGKLAYYLMDILNEHKINVTVVERDRARCETLSQLFPDTIVINGDGTNGDMLQEIGIHEVDSVVALTNIDEENILLAPFVESCSNAKFIAKISRNSYAQAFEKLQIDSLVCPKDISAEFVIAYVRSKTAAKGSNLERLVHLFDNQAEALEFVIDADNKVNNIPLKDLKLKEHVLITCISRDGSILIPGGNDKIQMGDTVIVVTTHRGFDDIGDILAEE